MLFVLFLTVTLSFLFSSVDSLHHYQKNRLNIRNAVRQLKELPWSSRTRISSTIQNWPVPEHITLGTSTSSSYDISIHGPPLVVSSTTPPSSPTDDQLYVINPITYGADPTGILDSSFAFNQAVQALLSRNTSGHRDESGTVDLGGAILDLQGGDYLISLPIVIPSNYSNYKIMHGTLRANPVNFSTSDYLMVFGTPNTDCVNWGDSCVENGSVEDLFLDGNAIAAGGIQFIQVIGFNAGPDLFVINFTTAGIDIEGGHEVILHDSWIASCWYTPPSLCWLNATALGNTVGVLVNGNDHYMTDSVVFGALTGVEVNGAANVFTNIHTWNTQSGSVPNASGILDTVWQNRYIAYLDFVPFVCQGCAVTTLTNSFFLGGAQILFRPHPNGYPVRGVYIAGNQFAGIPDGLSTVLALPPLPTEMNYSLIQDVTITGTMIDNTNAVSRSTVATVTVTNTTFPVTIDFTNHLVWNPTDPNTPIQTVSASVINLSTEPETVDYTILPPQGGQVTVIGTTHVDVTVTVTVDQSLRTGP